MAGFELFPKHFLLLFTPPGSLHVVDVRVHGAFFKSVRVQLDRLSDGSRLRGETFQPRSNFRLKCLYEEKKM